MDILLKAIPIAIPVILVILIFLMGYVKAPPDVAYIISGLRKHPKVLIGKAGIKIPFLERVDKLIVRPRSPSISSPRAIFPPKTSSAWTWTPWPRCGS